MPYELFSGGDVKHYEEFKTKASRLTSITCDGCDRELYVGVSDRSVREIKVHAPGEYRGFDLCAECFDHAKELLQEFVSP